MRGAIGALRHVTVHWHVESRALQLRMRNWKTVGDDGGGVLGNFISHCFHYLEWFCGPIAGLGARISGLPDDAELETTVAMAMQFKAGPLVQPVHELRVLPRHWPPHRILRRGRHAGAAQSRRRLHARLRAVLRQAADSSARTRSGRGSDRRAISRRPHCAGVAAGQACFSTRSNAAARRIPDLPKAIACSA